MTAANVAPTAAYAASGVFDETPERFLTGVIERSGFVAARTDDDGVIEWVSPAFVAFVDAGSGLVGQSLFALGEGRGARVHTLLRAVRDMPGRQATAEVD